MAAHWAQQVAPLDGATSTRNAAPARSLRYVVERESFDKLRSIMDRLYSERPLTALERRHLALRLDAVLTYELSADSI